MLSAECNTKQQISIEYIITMWLATFLIILIDTNKYAH